MAAPALWARRGMARPNVMGKMPSGTRRAHMFNFPAKCRRQAPRRCRPRAARQGCPTGLLEHGGQVFDARPGQPVPAALGSPEGPQPPQRVPPGESALPFSYSLLFSTMSVMGPRLFSPLSTMWA